MTYNYPAYDPQSSPTTFYDAYDCVAEGTTHAIEMAIGNRQRFSPRALAKMSGTTPQGNSFEKVVDTINAQGMIPYELWPDLDVFDETTYYAEITQSVLNQAVRTNVKILPYNLTKFPTVLMLQISPIVTHFVVTKDNFTYFDSYLPAVKNINYPVIGRWGIEVTMSNVLLVNNKGEYGFFVPATNDATLIDKSLNYDYPLPVVPGTQQVDWPNVKADITV